MKFLKGNFDDGHERNAGAKLKGHRKSDWLTASALPIKNYSSFITVYDLFLCRVISQITN